MGISPCSDFDLHTVSPGILIGLHRFLGWSCAERLSECHLGNNQRRESTRRVNADYAVEQRPPLTISTGISPANQQHQSKDQDFFTREQRWGTAFESSSIGISFGGRMPST